MSEIKRCEHCILPASLPSAGLDEHGICRHCRNYEQAFSTWDTMRDAQRKAFEGMVEKARRGGHEYDALVPLSGGKDSTYALYVCDRLYGLKCLCVTFDNGYLSDHARQNIHNAVDATRADHIFYRPNRNTLLALYRLFIERCGNFCPVCMRGISAATHLAVERFNIPLIVTGDGQRITYSAFIRELFEAGDVNFFRAVVGANPVKEEARALLADPYPWNFNRVLRAIGDLTGRQFSSVARFIPLWDYVDVPTEEMYTTLENEMGWTLGGANDEHSDCLLHNIVPYIHRLKFPEVTPTTLKNSARVRWGQMAREEALSIEEAQLSAPPEEPADLAPFLEEIGMTRETFHNAVRDWRTISAFRDKGGRLRSLYRRLFRGDR
ncbi:MAG: hypothetical protein EOM20_12590 [Spartobacteria bacterium]|nr:hypothetical protein [Spartobacteria bacterium]